ncbi:MAG TPA: DUF1993 domain-containing protein [Caulobacteraceae bacterium]|jgi:hypothetical protein|nr:DUF1993 domain-containing protein [Caulobacteraceae bacterium]HEX4095356.1 DUF1993 domain-containing protein [Caulobacteraceae bacterium]
MPDQLHAIVTGTFSPMLGSLSNWLDKGAQHAIIQGWRADRLPKSRLAPDMFDLTEQIESLCYTVEDGVALLTGVAQPQRPSNGTTIEDLKSRITLAIAYVEGAPEAAYEGAAGRTLTKALPNGLTLEANGLQFLRDWTIPNFYFHVVTAYDILRNNGVEIGKFDYLAHFAYAMRQTG